MDRDEKLRALHRKIEELRKEFSEIPVEVDEPLLKGAEHNLKMAGRCLEEHLYC